MAKDRISHIPIRKNVTPSIHRSVSFQIPSNAAGFSAYTYNIDEGFSYTRWGNPTTRSLELEIAELEHGEDALCFSSGMAAISGIFLGLLSKGDHVIAQNVCYPGVPEFLRQTATRFGVEVSFVDTSNLKAISDAVRTNTRVIHIETPANPILRLADISAIAATAKSVGAILTVDSTFATPFITQPLDFGADFVLHSITKYLGGHGDALGGVVVGRKEAITKLRREILIHLGAALDPFPSWLFLRSIETFQSRVEAHSRNATKIAHFIQAHPRVIQTNYPGLSSHPQFSLAARQMRFSGGVIAFQVENPEKLAQRIADDGGPITYAVSLAKPRTSTVYIPTDNINEHCYQLSGSDFENYKEWAGDGVFRLSVGLEDPQIVCEYLDCIL